MNRSTTPIIAALVLLLGLARRSAAAAALDQLREAAGADAPALLASPAARPAAFFSPNRDPRALDDLLDRVSAATRAGRTPIVLFDLDDTLVDTGGRNLRILKEFVSQPDVLATYPGETAMIDARRWTIGDMDYDITDTAKKVGVTNKYFLDALNDFWFARFFNNEYLAEDPAVPGAPGYVKDVVARGGVVVYLTGRPEDLRSGTEAMLRKDGFPVPDGDCVILSMKPDPKLHDADFKAAKVPEIAKLGVVVGGFENEPRNVDIFKQQAPAGLMIFLDTRTSGQLDPRTGKPYAVDPAIPWVADFRLP